MEKIVKERRFFYILLLICLAGFLVLPKICLADDFENIKLEELSKYLELPEKDANKLMDTLRQVFTTEGILAWSSGDIPEEKIAVAVTLLKVVTMQALSHLLVDAPIEITWGIIKNATKIARVFLVQDPSVMLDELEKESVKRAIDYGMNALLKNEIRVTPGAIKFKYYSYKGGEKEIVLQYVMIYKPESEKRARVAIRFYMPNSVEAPDAKKYNKGVTSLSIPDLKKDLPPFIVEVSGRVEKDEKLDNYWWIDENGRRVTEGPEPTLIQPTVKIDFPASVPDLGIKPLSFWEKQILKPIETTIKEVEVIITKVTGKSLGLTDIWEEVKKFISRIKSFAPAGLVETSTGGLENISNILNLQTEKLSPDNLIEVQPPSDETEIKQEQEPEQKLTLEEIQEILDDISEEIDIISQEIVVLTVSSQPISKENQKTVKKEEISEEETEEEIILTNAENSEIDQKLCPIISGITPLRNKVIFNEIAWMGTEVSVTHEWIELKNVSGVPVNLSSWQLLNKEKQIKIIFTREQFSGNDFLILERTNDNSLPQISADLIYTGALKNQNESLYLFDANCQFMDEIIAESNWPAGDNSSKRTMERKYDLGWQTSQNLGGTPKAENSSGYYVFAGGGAPPPPTQPQPQIILSYSQNSPVNKEVEVTLSASNLKNATYDVKISIENGTTTLSEIYNENLNKWRSPSYYVTSTLSGTSFSGNFRLRIKQDENDFRGEADIFAKIRETGKTSIYLQFSGKINITDPQENPTQNQPPFASFVFSPQTPFVGDDILFNAPSSTDSDGTITSYIWDFGDNATSTEIKATTTHNYSTSSDFLVSLTVVDNNNATGSATKTITITTPETPTLEVVINEIAWMGTATSSNDEWFELYNNSDQDIDLADWEIRKDGKEFIIFSTSSAHSIATTTILAYQYYLLESTNNNTISNIEANFIFKGNLRFNDEGNELELRDKEGNLIDKIGCFKNQAGKCINWFAGDKNLKISMERISATTAGTTSTNWANNNLITRNGKDTNGNNVNGTPKVQNSVSKSQTEIFGLPFDEFSEITLTLLGSPYIVQNTLVIPQGKTLNIEPGVTLKFFLPTPYGPNDGAYLLVRGSLKAIGQEGREIIFTSTGILWPGIIFTSDTPETEISSQLEYVKIEKARSWENGVYSQIKVEKKSISIKNSTIENNSNLFGFYLINSSSIIEGVAFNNFQGNQDVSGEYPTALYIKEGATTIKNSQFISNAIGIKISLNATPQIKNNIFKNNNKPVYFDGAYPIFENNQAENNTLNGIFVGAGSLTNVTWQDDLPYVIENGAVALGATLTLEPGVIVKFKTGPTGKAAMEIYGKILAQGTAANPVVFTSFYDDEYGGDTNNDATNTGPSKGDWYWLHFSSSGSVLDNTIIKYGGSEGPPWWMNFGAVALGEGIDVDIKNSVVGKNIYAVSFTNATCEAINAKINQFTTNNTVFQDNRYPTYPQCP
jgi:hypothetical protein